MKSTSKLLIFVLSVVFVMMFSALAISQEGYGQITLDNQTSSTADLYVDGVYGCRALAGLICTTQVRVGKHDLEARLTDGRSVSEREVLVRQGEVRTFTIKDKDR